MADTPLTLETVLRSGPIPGRTLEQVLLLCDGLRPLAADAHDLLAEDLSGVQGGNFLDPLAVAIRRGPESRKVHLISGLPGSGKSTALLRFQADLELARNGGRRFRVLYIDALDFVSLADVDFATVLVGILAELVRAFPPMAKASKNVASFWADIRSIFDGAEVEVDASLDLGLLRLGGRLKSDLTSRKHLRMRLPPLAERLIDAANAYATELRTQLAGEGYDDLVLIVDNLEKTVPAAIEGSSRDTFEATFFDGAPLFRRLDLHLVLTVPAALWYRDVRGASLRTLYGTEPRLVPMVRTQNRDGSGRHAAGVAALRNMLARRLDLRAVFGTDALVERLIDLSGGSVRTLLQLISEASLHTDSLPIRAAFVDGVARTLQAHLANNVPRTWFDGLAAVADTHEFPTEDTDNRVKVECLRAGFVLEYNGEGKWFDVDPVLREVPAFKEAMARRRGP